ncbi:AvaI/BsoBI family type II restriction endonuclease [Thermosynechococcus sp. PP45]|nr:AvaI/BsoBI family type II restriction endonuclease [Thermosynechococcus sp. HY213]MDR7922725.1 AvaI/BsoBI family type II restriction endonuclease [Thermosynechococcus sp. HY213]WKT80543.1 AvaI/BsoBI family type II restriction endonuclease [Thermosynechococcus sp. PP45]WNC24153.1 AvaI/BsoBI family type II restriction endonuclease [Thermosynechococcus sp. PP551]WNC26731.1 AvaI/BsoBI family type II restriction endonuclease [Thermosynechococcus sp. PP555]
MSLRPYRNHLQSSADLVTSHEATRAGFVALALEKNRRSTPYVAEARALQEAASRAKTPADLLAIKGIEVGLLRAAGLSDKALVHLSIGKLRERLLTVSVKRFRKRNTPRMFSLQVQRLRRKWRSRYGINWKRDYLPTLLT